MGSIPELDVHVDLSDPDSGIKTIINSVRPHWLWEEVSCKSFQKGGLANFLWKVSLAIDKSNDDVIIVRVFDPQKPYFDHDSIRITVDLLHQRGDIIAPVYCRFKNGFCYKFLKGKTLDPAKMRDPQVYKQVISKFHQYHAIDPAPVLAAVPVQLNHKNIDSFVAMFQGPATAALDGMERFTSNFPSRADLAKEIRWGHDEVYCALEKEFPMVLSHNDAHYLNIVHDEEEGSLNFIDFDVVCVAPEVADIAYHLGRDALFAFEDDSKNLLRDEAFIREWLQCYFSTHPQYKDQEISTDMMDVWIDGIYRVHYHSSTVLMLFMLLQIAIQSPVEYDYWRGAVYHHHAQKHFKAKFTSEPVHGVKSTDDNQNVK